MEETDEIIKTKRKLINLLVIFLGIASVCIGLIFFDRFSNKEEEAINLSELILNDGEEEDRYVKIKTDTLPILMRFPERKEDQFYYVIDVNNNSYIVNLSNETFKEIVETLDMETGRLKSAYELKGITTYFNEEIKKLIISDRNKTYMDRELNIDNFSEKFGQVYLKENRVSERSIIIYTIFALIGVFFIILAFGYVVPAIVKVNKGQFGFYNEEEMKNTLKKYIPDGEKLIAGIYGLGIEIEIKQVFRKCSYVDGEIVPNENNIGLEVKKCKYSKYDLYIGITQNNLIISECIPCKYYYKLSNVTEIEEDNAKEIKTTTKVENIGHSFLLIEIQNCIIKNALMGATNCTVTLKNGSILKFVIPKFDVSNYKEYRELIIECLNSRSV